MDVITRDGLEALLLPGRVIQTAIGKNGNIISEKMTMGFAHYSLESGVMKPHNHAEEICYIIDAKNSWVRFGSNELDLNNKVNLEAGMTLHIPTMECHVFEFLDDGYVDLIFFYSETENLRPED